MTEISLKAEELFYIGGWPVTNSILLAVLTLLILGVFAYLLRRKLAIVPGTFQGIVEVMLEEMLSLMDAVLGNRRTSERYLPLIATVFLFILVSNWLGLFPFVGSVGVNLEHGEHHQKIFVPLFRAPAADLNFTLVLALVAVVAVQAVGIAALGFKRHMNKYFTLKSPILSFAGILEFISEFVKIISFSFRLFGNVFAGEVLLIIIGFLAPFLFPLPFLFLEVFVGFIQAFIFAMLMLVFTAIAVNEESSH